MYAAHLRIELDKACGRVAALLDAETLTDVPVDWRWQLSIISDGAALALIDSWGLGPVIVSYQQPTGRPT
jgi:hypothetical protein